MSVKFAAAKLREPVMHQTADGRRHSVALIVVAAPAWLASRKVAELAHASAIRRHNGNADRFQTHANSTPWRPRSAAPVGRKALLGRTNMRLLIGQQADRRLVRVIYARLGAAPEVQQVVDLPTMLAGTDKVLVCARAPSVL